MLCSSNKPYSAATSVAVSMEVAASNLGWQFVLQGVPPGSRCRKFLSLNMDPRVQVPPEFPGTSAPWIPGHKCPQGRVESVFKHESPGTSASWIPGDKCPLNPRAQVPPGSRCLFKQESPGTSDPWILGDNCLMNPRAQVPHESSGTRCWKSLFKHESPGTKC